MPCLLITDVHEGTNEVPTVSTRSLLNPQSSEQSGEHHREEKTLWSFTAVRGCRTGAHA